MWVDNRDLDTDDDNNDGDVDNKVYDNKEKMISSKTCKSCSN